MPGWGAEKTSRQFVVTLLPTVESVTGTLVDRIAGCWNDFRKTAGENGFIVSLLKDFHRKRQGVVTSQQDGVKKGEP